MRTAESEIGRRDTSATAASRRSHDARAELDRATGAARTQRVESRMMMPLLPPIIVVVRTLVTSFRGFDHSFLCVVHTAKTSLLEYAIRYLRLKLCLLNLKRCIEETAMATAGGRHGGATASDPSGSIIALQDFFAASCAAYEPPRAVCAEPPLEVFVAPPESLYEFSHERAFGFLFADEMKVVRRLRARCKQGKELFLKIYFARGCASAIPPPPPPAEEASEVARVLRYYSGVYEVLQPQVAKLRLLCDYCTQSVVILSDTIQRIAAQENTHRVIPDLLLDSIIDVTDVLMQLNQLHETKASLRNDFSLFKRAFKHVKGDISDPVSVAKEIQRLQDFVGNTTQFKSPLWDSFRNNLTSVKRFEDVIYLLIRQCLSHLDGSRCLLPADRFKFIRVLPNFVAVLQTEPGIGSLHAFHGSEKKLIESAAKVVARFPVVPVYAELSFKPVISVSDKAALKPNFSLPPERQWDSSYDIAMVLQNAKAQSSDFVPRLLFGLDKVCKTRQRPIDSEAASTACKLLIEALRLVSSWKASVLLFLAGKYQRPKSDDQLDHLGVSLGAPSIEYQRVITHNVDQEECSAMLETIHMIKTLSTILSQFSSRSMRIINDYVYFQVQRFVQHDLVPILHRANKKKHSCAKILQDLRLVCGNWIRDDFPVTDHAKRRKERVLPDWKPSTRPTAAQLEMLRTAVNAVYAHHMSGSLEQKSNIFSFYREMKSCDVECLQEFHLRSADFRLLLNFQEVVNDLNSFGDLLFRELFLEMTRTPQIPIDDSLPWLLLKKSLTRSDVLLETSLQLSVLELYNDAASVVLRTGEQLCVMHEVHAEARLFFDHLVYVIADQVYRAVKSDCARAFIGSDHLKTLQASGSSCYTSQSTTVAIESVVAAVAGRHVDVLHEPRDLMLSVSGYLGARLTRDLASAISKMARPDSTVFVGVIDVLHVLRSTHSVLKRFFVLDTFEDLWLEASTTAAALKANRSFQSTVDVELLRLQRMVSTAVCQDLAVGYAFNARTQRFVRTPLPVDLRKVIDYTRAVEMTSLPSAKEAATASSRKLLEGVGLHTDCQIAFEVMHQPYRSFVGFDHVCAMVSLLSKADIVELVEDCIDLVVSQLSEVVHLVVPVLGAAIPPYRFPKLLYRSEGCYGYFEGKFKHIMDSHELEVQVFHSFRVIGNALLALQLLTQVLTSNTSTTSDSSSNEEVENLELFTHALERLHSFLVDTELLEVWGVDGFDTTPESADHKSSTFFLVWNALEFISCCPMQLGGASSYRELFGEGLQFAGCTLIHLLGQRRNYELWNPSQYVIDAHRHDILKQRSSQAAQIASNSKKRLEGSAASSSSFDAVGGALDPEMVTNAKCFVAQATQMRQSAEHFFKLLEASWPPPRTPRDNRSSIFSPPVK